MFDVGEHKYAGLTFCCRSFICDKSNPIVVSFHYAQNIPSIDDFNEDKDNIFGFSFLKSNQINVISISPLNRNSWYRDDEVVAFLSSIVTYIDAFPLRVGYGSSMGGFAVGAFSKLLKLDRALLLNPISTLDDNKAPFEKRFNSTQSEWKGIYSDASKLFIEGVLIYDPLCKEDRMHAKRFKVGMSLIPLIGAGHNVPKLLLDMKVLKQLVLSFIDTGIVTVDLRKRRECIFYYNNLIKNKKMTDSRARVINAHRTLLEYKNGFKFISGYSNKELYELEQSALKLASIGEYQLALNIIKNLIKMKPTSKRYESLYKNWRNLLHKVSN